MSGMLPKDCGKCAHMQKWPGNPPTQWSYICARFAPNFSDCERQHSPQGLCTPNAYHFRPKDAPSSSAGNLGD